MTTDPGRDLAAHGAALRGLARALVGGDDAEDLVQDGYAAVLQAGRGDVAELGSWLAGVLRRIAGKRRRRLAIERRHAHTGLVRDAAAAPSAAEQAAQRDLIAKLDAELLSLPEPYRATLIARYYESLPPTAIAARERVPVATVKSRLARGIRLMRERFEAQRADGSDWRTGLVAAFGLDRTTAATSAPAAAAGGVILMATWTKFVLPIAAAGVLAWLGLRGDGPDRPDATTAQHAEAASSERGDVVPPSALSLAQRAAAAAADTAPITDATITVRGRCVDEHGTPLAGVAVAITHRDPWEFAEHTLAQRVTGNDGRFSASIAAPPSRAVWIECVDPARVPVSELRQDLTPGRLVDLGDLPLLAGCVVHGRLLDDHGAPVEARVVPVEQQHDRVPTPRFEPAHADASGAFLLRLLPGSYRLFVPGERTLAGERLEVPTGVVTTTTRITVQSGLPSVCGTVVDGLGRPVPDAEVHAEERETGGRYQTRTDGDGRFVLKRDGDGAPHDVVLSARAPGLEHVRLATPVGWGSQSLRLELPACAGLELRVVDGATGAAVEDFAVRLAVGRLPYGDEVPGTRFAGADVRPQAFDLPRAAGHHRGGVLLLQGLRRDCYALRVEPLDPALAPSAVQLAVVDDEQQSLRVVLWPNASRALVLVAADGAPIPGCKVELCEPFRGEVSLQSHVATIDELSRFQTPDVSLLVQTARSDERGRCMLSASRGSTFSLRVLGPGCIPMVAPDVRLDGPSPLRIVVDRGAALRVEAMPAEVLGELAALTGDVARDDLAVGLRLRPAAARGDSFPSRRAAPIAIGDGGIAEVQGVPPGVFDVDLEWRVAATGERRHVGQVDLTSGRTTTLRVDLAPLRPGTIEGMVTRNGAPLADHRIELRGERQHRLRTDERGSFRFHGAPGTYRLVVRPGDELAELASAPVELRPGATTLATLDLRAAPLSLRFVDEQGRPVADVHEARVLRAADDWAATFPDSDADGRTALPVVDAGTLALRVMPRRLASIEAKQRHLAEHPDDQHFDAVDLDLGQVVVESGRDNVATVVLPAAYWR